MKSKSNRLMEVLAVATVMMISGVSQHAYGQAEKIGNGGKGYEAEFDGFKKEILDWTQKAKLNQIDVGSVDKDTIINTLSSNSVHVSFVDQDLLVAGKKRTCKNYPTESLIECQRIAWDQESIRSKYFLVFHELLGIAGFENNVGADSDYKISGQIRDFIDAKTVYTLSPIRVFKGYNRNEGNFLKQGFSCSNAGSDGTSALATKKGLYLVVQPTGEYYLAKYSEPRAWGWFFDQQCRNMRGLDACDIFYLRGKAMKALGVKPHMKILKTGKMDLDKGKMDEPFDFYEHGTYLKNKMSYVFASYKDSFGFHANQTPQSTVDLAAKNHSQSFVGSVSFGVGDNKEVYPGVKQIQESMICSPGMDGMGNISAYTFMEMLNHKIKKQ